MRVVLVALAVCVVYVAYGTISRMVDYYTPFPVWDYWRVVENLPNMQAGSWSFLWRQHNDHRIVFPELVFTVDMLWFHGRKILPLIVTFLCYAGTWVIISVPVISDRQVGLVIAVSTCCFAGCMALWHSVALVLSEPFLLQWTMFQVAVAFALLFLTRLSRNQGWLPPASVAVSAVVATYSSANGMLLWPLLWGLGLMLRLSRKQMSALVVVGVLAIGCYFIGFHSSGSLNLQNLLSHPLLTLGFIASYLSMPFGGMGAVEGRDGLVAGGIALTVSALCFFICLRRGWLREPPAVVLFGVLISDLLAAVMTAGGRMSPADATFGFAKALRYLSMPQMNWCAVILAALWTSARLGLAKVFVPVLCLAAMLLSIYLPKLQPWITANAEPFSEQQLVAVSYEDRVPNETLAFDRVFPDLHLLEAFNKNLEQSQKSIYYRGRGRWLNKPATQFAPGRPELPGAIVNAFPLETGFQVVGWADDSNLRKPVLWIVLADESGLIRGFARRFPAGFPNSIAVAGTPPSLAWAGYIPASMAGKRMLAYAVDPRKLGLMPLDIGIRIPQITAAAAGLRGESIPGITWTSKTTTGMDSPPIGQVPGDLPTAPVHATYGGSDAVTGSITSSSFSRPSDGCLIIPLLVGPSTSGLRANLEDSVTGLVVEELPVSTNRSRWQFLRVQADPVHQNLRVVVRDEGRGWGQWIGTSTPLHCQ